MSYISALALWEEYFDCTPNETTKMPSPTKRTTTTTTTTHHCRGESTKRLSHDQIHDFHSHYQRAPNITTWMAWQPLYHFTITITIWRTTTNHPRDCTHTDNDDTTIITSATVSMIVLPHCAESIARLRPIGNILSWILTTGYQQMYQYRDGKEETNTPIHSHWQTTKYECYPLWPTTHLI